jgi:HEPN domain-containing protein
MRAVGRTDLQTLAGEKLEDAKLLLRRRRHPSAYYLAGYAVEFALKAAIARQVEQHVLPDPRFIREVYQHDLTRLLGLANLRVELDKARRQTASRLPRRVMPHECDGRLTCA